MTHIITTLLVTENLNSYPIVEVMEISRKGRLHGRALVQIVFQKKCKCMKYKAFTSINISCNSGDYYCTPCIRISSGRLFELMTCRATTLSLHVLMFLTPLHALTKEPADATLAALDILK